MKQFFGAIGNFLCGTIKFAKNIVFITYVFLLITFTLTVIMPENVLQAIEIVKGLM